MPKPAPWQNRIVGHEDRDPKALKANEANWRRHPRAQQKALGGVLDEVGIVQGVIWNRRTERLVDGHLRVELALKRKEAAVPVTVVDLSEAEERLVLATLDPLAAMAEADDEALKGLLADIEVQDEALRRMLDELGGVEPPVPAAPDPKPDKAAELQEKWGTGRGQLWVIGAHRLLCGDCTVAADVERLMGGHDGTVALLTDPPYGIAYSPGDGGKGWTKGVKTFAGKDVVKGDEKPFDPSHLLGFDSAILWGANHYADKLPASPTWLVWDKRQEGLSNDFADCELAWSNIGGPARVFRHLWNGAFRASEKGQTRQHPTQKPVAVMGWCVSLLPDGAVVVDYYAGSGTTMVAAHQLNRRCYAMEIEPKYAAVCLERLADMGLSPELQCP